MTIGERLKTIRNYRGWTQATVSQKAKINNALYRQYECGDRIPKLKALIKIASALEVDIAFLQPSKMDSPMAILALLFDLIDNYGDVTFDNRGPTVHFGIDHMMNSRINLILMAAMNAHKDLSVEEFKKWLINYPPLVHNGEIVER